MYSYVCEIFALFATFLFARALFGKTLSTPTREARPDTLVEVWARSELCGSRGGRSKFFFRREWIRRFPGFRCVRPCLCSVVRFLCVSCREHGEHTRTAAAPQRACYKQYNLNVTTLLPSSSSSHYIMHARASDTCCTVTSCFCRSLRFSESWYHTCRSMLMYESLRCPEM